MTGRMKAGDLIVALARRRVQLGMPQVEVAELVGVSPQTVSKWEMGAHMPGVRELLAWMDAVDLDLVLRERVG